MARTLAGDLTGGADLLERALAGFRATGDEHLVFDTLILLASVRFFQADPRGAAAADEALALTGRHQTQWSRCWALWTVAIHRWRVGEHQQAADLLREAIALRLADRTLLAFLVEALAWCSSSDDEHDRTARLLGCAHALWRLTGTRIDETSPYRNLDRQSADRARAALGTEKYDKAFAEAAGFGPDEVIRYALREKPTRPGKPERAGEPSPLTRREQEIAELVARGMSNNDIATALVIGRRTVESHLQNILSKLGLTSRTQVASWLSGRSL